MRLAKSLCTTVQAWMSEFLGSYSKSAFLDQIYNDDGPYELKLN